MDLSRQELNANMRGVPSGWHAGESDPRAFHSHPGGSVAYFQQSDGAPRMRGAINEPGLLPSPNYFPTNPNYPPGFENGRMSPPGSANGYRNAPGFDNNNHTNRSGFNNSHNFHGEMMCPRGGHQGVKVELSQSRPASVAVKGCNAQDSAYEGGSSELPSDKAKKRKQSGAEDAQPAQGSSTAANNYERATKVCHKLWKDLHYAIQQRERDLREREQSFTHNSVNKEVLEEKKQAAAMKNQIMEERRRLEVEAQRTRKEKDAMERTSTDLAVQMVELKQVHRQLEKEKAALLARQAELSAKEGSSLELDCNNAIVDIPLVAVKTEIEEPVINPCRNFGKSTNCTVESSATPSNIQNQEPETAMDAPSISKLSPEASNRNLKSVKTEPVTSE